MNLDTIDGPLGSFLIPGDPENSRDHAKWICEGVWAGEYEDAALPKGLGLAGNCRARILDIGSHCGAFAVWARHRWGTGLTIDCYDPIEEASAIAQQNAPFARVHHVAVTSQPEAKLALAWDWGSAKTYGTTEGRTVPVLHPRDLPAAELLKCDAEGVEAEVLQHYSHPHALDVILLEWHSPELKDDCRAIIEARTQLRCAREQNDGSTYGVSVWVRP